MIETLKQKFRNQDFNQDFNDFFVKEKALEKGITIEEEWDYQKSTFDGIACDVLYQAINYMIELETELKINIPDEKASEFNNMNELFEHVEIELKNKL